jgi:hypothetical protein
VDLQAKSGRYLFRGFPILGLAHYWELSATTATENHAQPEEHRKGRRTRLSKKFSDCEEIVERNGKFGSYFVVSWVWEKGPLLEAFGHYHNSSRNTVHTLGIVGKRSRARLSGNSVDCRRYWGAVSEMRWVFLGFQFICHYWELSATTTADRKS